MEKQTREVLRKGKEDKGEDKEKGKGGGENKNNILIIIILKGRLTL